MENIDKIKLPLQASIRDALNIIDDGGLHIAVVTDENHQLIGLVSDGDIRRALLRGKNLEDSVIDILNEQPITVRKNESREDILAKAKKYRLSQLPVVDKNNTLLDVIDITRLATALSKSNPVILMVGGLGTRLRPLTDKIPKPLLKVGDKPILQTIIEQFKSHGFKNIILCVNYRSEMIKEYFGDGKEFGVNISYVDEPKRMGTAGALSLIKDIKEPFFVMNGDLLTNINFEYLYKYHLSTNAEATMCVREYEYQVPYGVIEMKGNSILKITEKPIQNFYVSAGIYMLDPSVLKNIPEDQFYDMPTLFEDIMESSGRAVSYPIKEYWMDIGQMDEFEKANEEYSTYFS